ncbi:MAG: ABC transporter permease [Candidatus Acidiferrales bacterium]
MDKLIQDIRYALRTFARNPGFAAIALLTLALGIGANTAIFTIVDAVMLRELPVAKPQQLVALTDPDFHGMSNGSEDGDRTVLAYSEFEYLRDHNEVFSGIFAADSSLPQLQVTITNPAGAANGSGDAANPAPSATQELARVRLVSGDYFQTLGVRAVAGHTFGPEVDRVRNSFPVAVISHGYWSRRFNLDPEAVGRRIEINKTAFEIIGVAPAGFFGQAVGEAPDMWVPATMQRDVYPGYDLLSAFPDGNIDQHMWLHVTARLKPGVTPSQASANVNVLLQQYIASSLPGQKLSSAELKDYANQQIKVQSGARGSSVVHGRFAEPLKLLMALVALVLLIACANLANLLLARGASRQREFAVRLSVGAARTRLVRQLLTESFLLAFAGGAAGLVLAQWADAVLLRMVSGTGRDAIELSLRADARILGFTFGIAACTAILFGLIPALRATRIDLSPMLKSGASGSTVEGLHRRLPIAKILVVAQVAVSLVLLVAAGLFVHSLQQLNEVKLGFNSSHLMLLRIMPLPAGYKDAAIPLVYQELLDKFKAVPGVSGVTLSVDGLFSSTDSGDPISVEGYTPAPGEAVHSRMDHVGPDYFSVVGMPILYGRGIEAQDSAPAGGSVPRVAVINQSFAKHFFPNTNPLGKRVRDTYPGSTAEAEIVGVVADAKYRSLREEAEPRLYAPIFNPLWAANAVYYEIRANGDAASISSALRAVVHDTNPALPDAPIRTMAALVTESLRTENFVARLASAFGLLAIVLAGVGLYGIMAFTVARRTRDIGIRMTLGASPATILRQVLRESVVLVAIGIAVGIPIALAGTRLVRSMLFGLGAADPIALGAACVILAAIAAAASYIPARRAARVDPMVALRYE